MMHLLWLLYWIVFANQAIEEHLMWIVMMQAHFSKLIIIQYWSLLFLNAATNSYLGWLNSFMNQNFPKAEFAEQLALEFSNK